MTDRSLTRCCSEIRAKVPEFLEHWSAYSRLEARVIQTVRSTEYQQELYAQGRTTPGPGVDIVHPLGRTVTNCDGVDRVSNHQIQEQHGESAGHAVDIGLFENGNYIEAAAPYSYFATLATAVGLHSGWTFSFVDPDHLECPGNFAQAAKEASMSAVPPVKGSLTWPEVIGLIPKLAALGGAVKAAIAQFPATDVTWKNRLIAFGVPAGTPLYMAADVLDDFIAALKT